MTDKIKITDEMVSRAAHALIGLRPVGEEINSARRILEYALNTPPAPEIMVTEEMRCAGEEEVYSVYNNRQNSFWYAKAAVSAYCAMCAVRPKENPTCEPKLNALEPTSWGIGMMVDRSDLAAFHLDNCHILLSKKELADMCIDLEWFLRKHFP